MPYSSQPHQNDRSGHGLHVETPSGTRRMSMTQQNFDLIKVLLKILHVTKLTSIIRMEGRGGETGEHSGH